MTTDTNIDGQLVASALTGDVKAFGRLVERHHGAVVAVAYAITRELATAEDIAQETFCTAWTGLGALRDPAAIRPWLCNIARNRSRNALRAQRRIASDEPSTLVDDAASVRDAMVDRETASEVQAALADVPETYREPLVLFYWEGQSIESVAETLAITAAAAQKRISRARGFIKETLTGRLAEVGRGRRTATVAAAAIVAVCSTRPVASAAGAPALAPSGAATGISLVKVLAAVAAVAVLALTVAAVTGHAPWQRDARTTEATTMAATTHAGSAAVAAPVPPNLAARAGSATPPKGGPGAQGRDRIRGGFGTPTAYELTVLDPMHVAVNLHGGASGVFLYEPPPPSPPFNRTLRGRVTDSAGAPIAYAVVLVGEQIRTSFDSVMADQGALTGADGTFNVVVHDDKAKLAVALHPKAGWSPRVAVAAGSDETTLAIKIPSPGSLVGRVTRGGSPIDAKLSVLPLDSNGFDLMLDTDTRGTFELPLLAPGRYRVSASAQQDIGGGSSPQTTQEITIASGAPTKLTLELAVGVLVVARVRAPADVKLATVEYTLVAGGGTFDVQSLRKLSREQKAHSYLLGGQDAGREAQFHDVQPGAYTLCVDARPDYDKPWPLVCRPLAVAADRTLLELDVDVKP